MNEEQLADVFMNLWMNFKVTPKVIHFSHYSSVSKEDIEHAEKIMKNAFRAGVSKKMFRRNIRKIEKMSDCCFRISLYIDDFWEETYDRLCAEELSKKTKPVVSTRNRATL